MKSGADSSFLGAGIGPDGLGCCGAGVGCIRFLGAGTGRLGCGSVWALLSWRQFPISESSSALPVSCSRSSSSMMCLGAPGNIALGASWSNTKW